MIENAIQIICVYAIPLIFAITLHEAAHGWAAKKLGDDTAWILGRVTANPVPHIDPVGTVLVPGALVLMSALTGGAGFVVHLYPELIEEEFMHQSDGGQN